MNGNERDWPRSEDSWHDHPKEEIKSISLNPVFIETLPLDELGQLLHDLNQLISGFAQDEVWSEWDESVRQRLIQMQLKVNELKGVQ